MNLENNCILLHAHELLFPTTYVYSTRTLFQKGTYGRTLVFVITSLNARFDDNVAVCRTRMGDVF